MTKTKRTVTVDNSGLDNEKSSSHRLSVFERLGPGAASSSSKDRVIGECRNWLKTGECMYGEMCKYQHPSLYRVSKKKKSHRDVSKSPNYRKKSKSRKERDVSRTPPQYSSVVKPSSRATDKHGSFFKVKSDHESSKLKSTIVRPKSPVDIEEKWEMDKKKKSKKGKREVVKKPLEQQWEEDEQEDSDDWDANNLDYKGALTLERKRQELQRALELEDQKEAMMEGKEIENVIVSKRVVSSSSSCSSSSRSSSGSSSSRSSSYSSSSSGSGSDSDSSGSSSSSGRRYAKARGKLSRKKVGSFSPQRHKIKHDQHYKAVKGAPPSVAKAERKKGSKSGPRTPSPHKLSGRPRHIEQDDIKYRDDKQKKRYKNDDSYKERRRDSTSPDLNVGAEKSSGRSSRTKERQKEEVRKQTKKYAESPSPSKNSSSSKKDEISSKSGYRENLRKDEEWFANRPKSLERSSKDHHQRQDNDNYKRHSPDLDRRTRSRQRSQSPNSSYSLKDKERHSRNNRQLSLSPQPNAKDKSRSEHPKESRRDDVSQQRNESYSSGHKNDKKSGRYQEYYEEDPRKQRPLSQSPNRSRSSRYERSDTREPSPHQHVPSRHHSNDEVHDRRRDKDIGRVYRNESPKRQDYETNERDNQDRRVRHRDADYLPPKGNIHIRDPGYPTDRLREQETRYQDVRYDPVLYRPEVVPRDIEYERPPPPPFDYHQDRNYYPPPHGAIRGVYHRGGRDEHFRGTYTRHYEPEGSRKETEIVLPEPDRYGNVRIITRDVYPPPGTPMADHPERYATRRGGRQAVVPYPEPELQGKRDWLPAAEHPGYPREYAERGNRYGARADYSVQDHRTRLPGSDQRSLDNERKGADPYYGGRGAHYDNYNDPLNKRRRDNYPSSGGGWESDGYRNKRDLGNVDKEYPPSKYRDREDDKDTQRDGAKVLIRTKSREPIEEEHVKDTRRGRKRDRYPSPDTISELSSEKRRRDDDYNYRKQDDKESIKSDRSRDGDKRRSRSRESKRGGDRQEGSRRDDKSPSKRSVSHDRGSYNSQERRDRSNRDVSRDRSYHGSVDGSTKDEAPERTKRRERNQSGESQQSRKRNASRECISRRKGEKKRRKDAPSEQHSRANSYDGESSGNGKTERDEIRRRSNEDDPTEQSDIRRRSRDRSDKDDDVPEGAKKSKNADTKDWEETIKDDDSIGGGGDGDGRITRSLSKERINLNKVEHRVIEEALLSDDECSAKSVSPIPEKTVVVDELEPSDRVSEERVIDACQSSDVEDVKEDTALIEEELSDWSDGDDELLTREEIVEPVEETKEKEDDDDKDSNANVETVKEKTTHTVRRVEEIKSSHGRNSGGSRSSSLDRGSNRGRSNRSRSSERSFSREGSRERIKDRGRRSYVDCDRSNSSYNSSRSSSRNRSLDRYRSNRDVKKRRSGLNRGTDDKQESDKSKSNAEKCDDYDPISDEELEAMIEDPDNDVQSDSGSGPVKKSGIVDALDVDWASLMGQTERPVNKPSKTKATQRYKPVQIFSRLGFSVAMAGPELSEEIKKVCTEELKKEAEEDSKDDDNCKDKNVVDIKFELENDIAGLHAAAVHQRNERDNVLTDIGPYRRALCARQDLLIRRKLCQFHHRLPDHLSSVVCPSPQQADPELYQLSVQQFKKTSTQSEIICT